MDMTNNVTGLSSTQMIIKRTFDIVLSFSGLLLTCWVILFAFIAASLDTRASGFFIQKRVGRNGQVFRVIKIRTMCADSSIITTVTTGLDPRITRLGRFFRWTKIDELPQLINVLKGEMSFVGPRPDVPGFADLLQGEEQRILSIRPGITGPATLRYRNEEEILAAQDDPERYNSEVIWPDKVRINLEYICQWSFSKDIGYIIKTVFK